MNYEELFKWITPIVVGFCSALFASQLALRKFKSEKTWDERRSAYKEVIESLEELIHWAEQVRATHCCEPTIDGEALFYESLRNISKFSLTGSLIFSTKFQAILEKTNADIHRARFEIDEESRFDLDSEREMHEWRFILTNAIRKIAEDNLPKLISVARSEKP